VPQDRLAEAQTQFAGQLCVTPTSGTTALILNTHRAPFTDVRVRRAINYAVDLGKVAALLGAGFQPACQILPIGLPGYRRYCPYTTTPDPAGVWHRPELARAEQLIAASGTRGTSIAIWNLWDEALAPADHYIASLLDRLGYPTHIKDFAGADPTGDPRFADSRTAAQATLYAIPIGLPFPPPLRSSKPTSPANRSSPARPSTQIGGSSATTDSTPRSTARSTPKPPTRQTPPRSGHEPTAPRPTKPQQSR
jgi:hypothetical protein